MATELFNNKRIKASGEPAPPLPSENPKTVPAEPKPEPIEGDDDFPIPAGNPDEPGPDDPYEDDEPRTAAAAAERMSEIEMLKTRARLMGINFSNNIGLSSLRAKVQAKLDGETEVMSPEEISLEPPSVKPVLNIRQQMYNEEMKLVRLRITNLDPKKKDLPGEIFTVANEMLGVVKKYIPYGEATDNGYHVPYIIYRQLREREFLNIKTRKDNRGRTVIETGMAREFALEILPQLTQRELNQLAASQAAAAGMSN